MKNAALMAAECWVGFHIACHKKVTVIYLQVHTHTLISTHIRTKNKVRRKLALVVK